MHFSCSHKKGDDYIKFLLRKFSHKSIFINFAENDTPADDIIPVVTDDENIDDKRFISKMDF